VEQLEQLFTVNVSDEDDGVSDEGGKDSSYHSPQQVEYANVDPLIDKFLKHYSTFSDASTFFMRHKAHSEMADNATAKLDYDMIEVGYYI